MTTRVAFLRAVNVGRRRVSNARLVEILGRDLGYEHVWTFINSGNVVFTATGSRASLERSIGSAIEQDVGFEVTTFVRSAVELRTIISATPFELEPGDTHFLTFLVDVPPAAQQAELEGVSNTFDTLVVTGRDVHWRMRGKSTDSRLVKRDWERILGRNASTSRNLTMITRLVDKVTGC